MSSAAVGCVCSQRLVGCWLHDYNPSVKPSQAQSSTGWAFTMMNWQELLLFAPL